jgi:DNA polymerase III sliding clamp (beta) subunit (PCNA family)
MKFNIEQKLLSDTLARMLLGPTNSPNPALALVHVEAQKRDDGPDALVLRAHSGLAYLETVVAANVQRVGMAPIHARAFAAAAHAMPSGVLTLSDEGGRVTMVSSSGRRWSRAKSTLEVPRVEEPPVTPRIAIDPELFLGMCSRVEFALADINFEGHRELDGLRVDSDGTALNLVVLGAYFGGIATAPLALPTMAFTLPTHFLGVVKGIAEEARAAKGSFSFYRDSAYVFALGPHSIGCCALPHGDYMPWRSLLGSASTTAACFVPRLALLETLRALRAMSQESQPTAALTLSEEGLAVAHAGDESSFNDEIAVFDRQPGLPGSIALHLNADYLHGAVRALDEDVGLVFDQASANVLYLTTRGSNTTHAARTYVSLMRP